MNRNSLAVCMIVKNEAFFLEECLKRVQKIADELIIVDTGSQDETAEIAQRYGAQVLSFTWNDDFSAARNFGLEKVTCDWVLVLDADEVVEPEAVAQFKHATIPETIGGFRVIQRTYSNNPTTHNWVERNTPYSNGFRGYCDALQTRLFRRGFDFSGAVHESVDTAIRKSGKAIKESTLFLHHYQYLKGDEFVADKQKRYLDYSKKMIAQEPNNPKHYCDAGIILQNYFDAISEAIEYFKKTLEINPRYETAYHNLVAIYVSDEKHRDLDAAETLLKEALDKNVKSPQVYANLGSVLWKKSQLDDAIVYFIMAIKRGHPNKKKLLSRIQKIQRERTTS